MSARFQQLAVLSALVGAIVLSALLWTHSVLAALAGLLCMVMLYVGLFATQFALMTFANRGDSVVRASSGELLRALLSEALVAGGVFFWWQPFRSNAIPDQSPAPLNGEHRRGVVFVHGFLCNRGLWNLWLNTLHGRQIAFVAVNLEPVFGPIDGYASAVDKAVRQITQETGKPPLLVCHSMGGLVARAWLRLGDKDTRVHHVVTIGSPHGGTMLGNLGLRLPALFNAEQMRFGSEWLCELARQETPDRAKRFTCFYSNCDNIVMPASTAQLHGADNRLVPGVAHLALVFDPSVVSQTLAML